MNNDSLEQIVFLFVSRKNANNARYIPLFSETRKVRIVFFRGLNIRYTDIIVSKMFVTLIKLFRFKINKYKVIHFFNLNLSFKVDNQILHIDDPTYTENEIDSILISPIGNMEIPGSIEKKIEYLYDFARMVLADNVEHADEIYMLEKFCRTFDFKGDNVKELSAYLIESAKQGKSKEQLLNELN